MQVQGLIQDKISLLLLWAQSTERCLESIRHGLHFQISYKPTEEMKWMLDKFTVVRGQGRGASGWASRRRGHLPARDTERAPGTVHDPLRGGNYDCPCCTGWETDPAQVQTVSKHRIHWNLF